MAQSEVFFNEIYGTYYRIVEEVLRLAQVGKLKSEAIYSIVKKHGFAESSLYIPSKLKSQDWPLLLDDMTTPLTQPVGRPLTLLEKRWLKALLLDPRIKLFDIDGTGLEDVEPLFRPEQFVYFDQYANGDDFQNADYQKHFRVLLRACEEKSLVELEFKNNMDEIEKHIYFPLQLEYSVKDDKFRLRAQKQGTEEAAYNVSMVNLGRIVQCKLLEQTVAELVPYRYQKRCVVEFLLEDERNALERVLLHFSGMEKRTQKLGDKLYRMQLVYNKSDRLEMVIRVLSFGPLLKLVPPKEIEDAGQREQQAWFWNELRRRLKMQAGLYV